MEEYYVFIFEDFKCGRLTWSKIWDVLTPVLFEVLMKVIQAGSYPKIKTILPQNRNLKMNRKF
jgi:hypothetical protein